MKSANPTVKEHRRNGFETATEEQLNFAELIQVCIDKLKEAGADHVIVSIAKESSDTAIAVVESNHGFMMTTITKLFEPLGLVEKAVVMSKLDEIGRQSATEENVKDLLDRILGGPKC